MDESNENAKSEIDVESTSHSPDSAEHVENNNNCKNSTDEDNENNLLNEPENQCDNENKEIPTLRTYYQSDGTIYVVESTDHVTIERYLAQQSIGDVINPSTLCYIKRINKTADDNDDDDGDASASIAVFAYKIFTASSAEKSDYANEPGQQNSDDVSELLFLCLACEKPASYASRDSLLHHFTSCHDGDDVPMTSSLNDQWSTIILRSENGQTPCHVAYMLPILADNNDSGFLNLLNCAKTSSNEMTASQLLQLHSNRLDKTALLSNQSSVAMETASVTTESLVAMEENPSPSNQEEASAVSQVTKPVITETGTSLSNPPVTMETGAALPSNRLNSSTDDNDEDALDTISDSDKKSPPPTMPNFYSRCHLHPDGKSTGVECPKCDLILGSSRSLGGHMTMMHSRNSCKTLKCPKCNWHYKYQETLEIHMAEKHNETPTSCAYCISNLPHPRLGRGEQWGCGYKPYRCDICKYSTLTKGNLSIHMQSDKHLNNVQEMQQGKLVATLAAASGGNPGDASAAAAAAATAALLQSVSILPQAAAAAVAASAASASCVSSTPNFLNAVMSNSVAECAAAMAARSAANISPKSSASAASKPTFRCDVCDYETTVARNLRIHNTSEKHAQNALIWQQSAKNFQPQQSSSGKSHFQQSSQKSIAQRALAGVADNGPFATSSTSVVQGSAAILTLTSPTCADDALTSSLALSFQNVMFEAALLNDAKLLQCCVCLTFTCDIPAELMAHCQNADRSRQNDSDTSMVAGNYFCNLCHYKTTLKANFHLHIKTDKHMQRLQLVKLYTFLLNVCHFLIKIQQKV